MLLGAAPYIDTVLRFKSNMDSGMFRPIQEAAIAAMQMDASFFENNNKIYSRRRRIIYDLLDDIGFGYEKNTAGLFVWSDVGKGFNNGEEASDFFLYKCHVFVPPGDVFGTQGRQYIRWSFCAGEQVLNEAAGRIRKELLGVYRPSVREEKCSSK